MAEGPLPPLVALGRDLRDRGLPVGTGRILTFVRGVAAIGLVDRTSLYWTARATMVASRTDLDTFDAAFDAWFRTLRLDEEPELSFEFDLPPDPEALEPGDDLLADVAGVSTAATWHHAGEDEEPAEDEESAMRLVASAVEVLRSKSFAYLNEEERQRVAKLIRELRVHVPIERTRRTRSSSKGTTLDVRRTLRRSLRTQGEPFDREWRSRRTRTRPLVLILDVVGLDGAVLAGAVAVRLRGDGGRTARRGLLLRDAPDSGHARPADEGPRSRDARDRTDRGGLGGRHADRRVAEELARRLEPARRAPRRGRRPVLRRPRARRPRRCSARRWRACAAWPTGWSGRTR